MNKPFLTAILTGIVLIAFVAGAFSGSYLDDRAVKEHQAAREDLQLARAKLDALEEARRDEHKRYIDALVNLDECQHPRLESL